MDSTTILYEYQDRIAIALSFDYASKHNRQELRCASWNCEKLGIKHIIIELDFMQQYFHSSLLQGGQDIPEGEYKEIESDLSLDELSDEENLEDDEDEDGEE